MDANPSARPARRREILLVAALLLVHLALLLDGARRDSATYDEPAFLAGAIAAWHGDRSLWPFGGLLPQVLQGAPLVASGIALPGPPEAWPTGEANALGFLLLHRSSLDPQRVLLLGRLPIILASLVLALVVHRIARRLFGPGGALVSLALFALCPPFLALGRLATADLLAALTLLSATWLAHACLRRITPARVAASCAVTGLAFLAKMSAVLLLPVIAALVAWRWARGERSVAALGSRERLLGRHASVAAAGALVVAHAIVTVVMIWAGHGFRYSAFEDPALASSRPLADGGWPALEREGLSPAVAIAREHRLLPEAWLFGFQYTLTHARQRPAWLEGRFSATGWWWFFPRALVLKMPLATLALVALGAVALARGGRADAPGRRADASVAPIVVLLGVSFGVAMTSHLNIGFRHVLPAIPCLLVLAGAAWPQDGASRRARALAGILLALAALEGMSARRQAVAWMNVAAGPEERRWRRLVDSSLDWGQGLPSVARELAASPPAGPLHAAYFGVSDPRAYGIDARGLWGVANFWHRPDGSLPEAGSFLVSATCLVNMYSNVCPGPWRASYEDAWRRTETLVHSWREADEAGRARIVEDFGADAWRVLLREHAELVMGRLSAFLRRREPDRALAGGSMLLYRLDEADVAEALFGEPPEIAPPGSEPRPAVVPQVLIRR